MVFVLGCLAPFVWAVMYYANYVVQISGVIAEDQRVGPRLGYVITDWAVLRENYDTVLWRVCGCR